MSYDIMNHFSRLEETLKETDQILITRCTTCTVDNCTLIVIKEYAGGGYWAELVAEYKLEECLIVYQYQDNFLSLTDKKGLHYNHLNALLKTGNYTLHLKREEASIGNCIYVAAIKDIRRVVHKHITKVLATNLTEVFKTLEAYACTVPLYTPIDERI